MRTTELQRPRARSYECAEQCREMGIAVGDTVEGRETYNDGSWSDTALTLLWLGESIAVWMEMGRSSSNPEWICKGEASNWTMNCRPWFKRTDSR